MDLMTYLATLPNLGLTPEEAAYVSEKAKQTGVTPVGLPFAPIGSQSRFEQPCTVDL